MAEQTNGDEATLSCSVSTYGSCDHQVTWLCNGNKLDNLRRDVRTSQSPCSATVTFPKLLPTLHYISTSSFISFTCQVNDGHKVRHFAFSPQSSEEKGGEFKVTPNSFYMTLLHHTLCTEQYVEWCRSVQVWTQ